MEQTYLKGPIAQFTNQKKMVEIRYRSLKNKPGNYIEKKHKTTSRTSYQSNQSWRSSWSPSTLLKELIENSLDAGSTRIEIDIAENLTDYIVIKDNGHGMTKDELPLAFSRHATSKISNFNDIYQIFSFGFRGEALASIASVSEIEYHSTLPQE